MSARVVPFFKKNDKTEVGNYHPVSILSVLPKTLEKLIYGQGEGYLSLKGLLYEYQSGFKQGQMIHVLYAFLDFIRLQMDKGHFVDMVLFDIQKALIRWIMALCC